MKIGDYVRIKVGLIRKILAIEDCVDGSNNYIIDKSYYNRFNQKILCIDDTCIIKSSPNIIDLIELGDYVNGYRVLDKAQAPEKALYLNDISQKCALIPVYDYQIKSIVTKEQFESMEYKVVE